MVVIFFKKVCLPITQLQHKSARHPLLYLLFELSEGPMIRLPAAANLHCTYR